MFSSHMDMIYKNSALQDIFVKLLFILNIGSPRRYRSFLLLLLLFLEKLSPSCTLVTICWSGWIVWIKREILIINAGNHLDGQLWQKIVKRFKSSMKRFKYSFTNQNTWSPQVKQYQFIESAPYALFCENIWL